MFLFAAYRTGMTTSQSTSQDIRSFRVEIPETDIADLNDRLARSRFAAPAPGDDWTYGTPVHYLREMVEYWRTSFDWRAQEARMNAFPQYLTEIDGQTIHFIHVPSAEPEATPLLLAHSTPGSFAEFLDMIGPLTDPVAHGGRAEDAFSVVVPSIPGFGFSTPVVDRGWTTARVARTFDALMRALGYDRYGAHGSDSGATIARELGVQNVPGYLGAHVLQLFSFPSGDPSEFESFGPEEYAALEFLQWFQERAGFAAMLGSRPQTVAAGLADSPVGQLAWSELFENFGNGSHISKDQILMQVSLAWFTNTWSTMGRYYFEDTRANAEPAVNAAPTGVAVFVDDFKTIRPLAERDNSAIVHWSTFDKGGHFASMEVPDVLTGDIRAFFAGLRASTGAATA